MIDMMEIKTANFEGVVYVNTTPHVINLLNPDTGNEVEIPPSGVIINAKVVETVAGETPQGVKLVRTKFCSDEKSEEILAQIEQEFPGAVIIGSLIAAQAFPGRIYVLTPAPGFERVPPDQKRMNSRKFTIF